MKQLATNRPITFSLFIMLLMFVLYIIAGVLAATIATTDLAHQWIEAAGRIVAAALLLILIWRMGWVGPAGVTRIGSLQAWLITIVVLLYEIITYLYAEFGAIRFGSPGLHLIGAVAANARAAGLLEEVAARGLMLYAMTRLWAGTREGLIRTVLVSAGIFGASHLIHIALGKPVPQTLLLAISAGLGGVFYGTITLRGGSIWPAVVAHGVLNGVISVAVLNQPDYSQTVSAWLLIILSQIPVALFSAYLIARTPTRSTIPDAP